MLSIYTSLGWLILILAVIYVIFNIVSIIKKKHNNVESIKIRIVLTASICALFIVMIIPAIMLGKSIVSEIFYATFWAIHTVIELRSLKYASMLILLKNKIFKI